MTTPSFTTPLSYSRQEACELPRLTAKVTVDTAQDARCKQPLRTHGKPVLVRPYLAKGPVVMVTQCDIHAIVLGLRLLLLLVLIDNPARCPSLRD